MDQINLPHAHYIIDFFSMLGVLHVKIMMAFTHSNFTCQPASYNLEFYKVFVE